ncbi:MAG: hypothetical protein COV46_06215 [Deltaproteobacteria bacterium CG11_big_fil_rev_8_21_14_0_20_49_13]|nr:MAG: hypothetical protein COV46_06215 [Deltaproteobacteria bacterium CG11_big_fil_rev_8_21_14_0_20_49_13]
MKKFDNLIVIGRPACGKSEFIYFMKNKVTDAERLEKFHIGQFEEVDDFVWLWDKCLEDDVWEALGHKRLVSKKSDHAYFIDNMKFWDFLIEKFSPHIEAKYLVRPEFYKNKTLLIEFARGKDDAYKNALWRFSKKVLERSAILFIDVSFEESCRKNEARYREKLKSSILAHKVPDEEMNGYYKVHDWKDVTDGKPNGRLSINGINVPFVTMNNEPELKEGPELELRYKTALDKLAKLV